MSIYQHFRKHEHPFVDQVLSWQEQVERTYSSYLTDFLDPRERQIVASLIGSSNEEIKYLFFGGSDDSERQRAIIAPFYEEILDEHFEIHLLQGDFASKFNRIEHRDVLGAFMSLGIDRKKIGDIIVAENAFQMIVAAELSSYIKLNMTQINHAKVRLEEKSFNALLKKRDRWISSIHTVSSLRLDIVVKEIYRMSRNDATAYIKTNRVKVNFKDVDDPSLQVIAGDLISVRGHGRSKVEQINGKTRKGKIRMTAARLKT